MDCNIKNCQCTLGKKYTDVNYKIVLIMELHYLVNCLLIKINNNKNLKIRNSLKSKIFDLYDAIDEIYKMDDFYLPSYCPEYLTKNKMW